MPRRLFFGLAGSLVLAALASFLTGYRWLSPVQILYLFSVPDPALSSFVLEYRLPRMLIAPICGAGAVFYP